MQEKKEGCGKTCGKLLAMRLCLKAFIKNRGGRDPRHITQ